VRPAKPFSEAASPAERHNTRLNLAPEREAMSVYSGPTAIATSPSADRARTPTSAPLKPPQPKHAGKDLRFRGAFAAGRAAAPARGLPAGRARRQRARSVEPRGRAVSAAPFLSRRAALRVLRSHPGARLIATLTKRGAEFCISPGCGRVLSGDAQELARHQNVVVADEGLLHDCPQSWRHIDSVDRIS